MSRGRTIVIAWVVACSAALVTAVRAESRFNEALMEEELRIGRQMNKIAMDSLGNVNANSPPSGPELEAEIAAARQAFINAYRSRAGLPEASARFGRLLARKDGLFLVNELWMKGVFGQGHTYWAVSQTDGGIVPGAEREFNDWVAAIRSKAEGNDGGEIVQRLRRMQLLDAFPKHQTAYVVARNWGELHRAGIQLGPQQFAWMLVQRYPLAKDSDVATRNFKAMIELFGLECVMNAAAKLAPLPRDAYGRCTGLEAVGIDPASKELAQDRINGVNRNDPLDGSHAFVAWLVLIGRDSPKRGFIISDSPGLYNSPGEHLWVYALARYRRLVVAYGQQQVDETAQRCVASGANVTNALAADDLDGYLRYTLAMGESLDSAEAIAKRVAELEAHAGKDAVRQIATAVRTAHLARGDLSRFGAGLNDPCAAIVSTLQPPVSNNPWYRAWARFPVGSKAVYTIEDIFSRGGKNRPEVTFELLSVGPQKVVVGYSRVGGGPNADPANPRRKTGEFECPAALDPAHFDVNGSATRAFSHRVFYGGYEGLYTQEMLQRIDPTERVVNLAGASLRCTRRLAATVRRSEAAWISDQVPGGLVKIGRGPPNQMAAATSDYMVLVRFEGKPAAPAAVSGINSCLNCAAAREPEADQCPTCGIVIGPVPGEVLQEAPAAQPAPPSPTVGLSRGGGEGSAAPAAPPAPAATGACNACGTRAKAGAKFCTGCGAKLTAAPPAAPVTPAPVQRGRTRSGNR